MWPFRKRGPSATDQLLQRFLALEESRLAHAATMEDRRQQLELQRLKIEVENAETLQKVKAQEAKDREELRQTRAKATAIAREAKAAKRVATQSGAGAAQTPDGCRVCANPSDPTLTTHDVNFHYSGHRGQTDLFRQ